MVFCVREDMRTKEIKFVNLPYDLENIFVKINLLNQKWLLCGCNYPPSQQDIYLFNQLGNTLDKDTQNYEKFLLIGDFNAEDSELKPV